MSKYYTDRNYFVAEKDGGRYASADEENATSMIGSAGASPSQTKGNATRKGAKGGRIPPPELGP